MLTEERARPPEHDLLSAVLDRALTDISGVSLERKDVREAFSWLTSNRDDFLSYKGIISVLQFKPGELDRIRTFIKEQIQILQNSTTYVHFEEKEAA